MKSWKTTKKNKINEIDLSFEKKIVHTRIESDIWSNLLINMTIKKLITVKIAIEKTRRKMDERNRIFQTNTKEFEI